MHAAETNAIVRVSASKAERAGKQYKIMCSACVLNSQQEDSSGIA